MNAATTRAVAQLASVDPILRRLIDRIGPCRLKIDRRREPWETLVRAVASQQLHTRAAANIIGRVAMLVPGQAFPQPRDLVEFDANVLRGCGLSAAKTAAVHDIARRALDGFVPARRAALALSNEELIARLVQIRGIGRWTVEMLLIFNLGRPDVLPVDDFGVREGWRVTAGLATQPRPRELAAIGERWAPYRSTAAWYLWRSRDPAPPAASAAPRVARRGARSTRTATG